MTHAHDTSQRVHLVVTGRVQGVFYRASTRDRALEQGVRGGVRNRDDGSVEAVFEGPEADVDAVIAGCHEGPPQARVEHVTILERGPAQGAQGFVIDRS